MPDYITKRAADVVPGDLIDLECDRYADPQANKQQLAFELIEVESVEQESDSCVAIWFEGFDCVGFPPDHKLKCQAERANQLADESEESEEMTPEQFWLAAASWGSYMTGGDRGACMYGFDHNGKPQSESHRQDCLDWIRNQCLPLAHGREDKDESRRDVKECFSMIRYLEGVEL